MFARLLRSWVIFVERAVAVALAVLAAIAFGVVMVNGVADVVRAHMLSEQDVNDLLERFLTVFVVIELFRIAVAYSRGQNVVLTVMEAALVAVVRKVVTFEIKDDFLAKSIALSALLVAVSIAWFLLRGIPSRAEKGQTSPGVSGEPPAPQQS